MYHTSYDACKCDGIIYETLLILLEPASLRMEADIMLTSPLVSRLRGTGKAEERRGKQKKESRSTNCSKSWKRWVMVIMVL